MSLEPQTMAEYGTTKLYNHIILP